MKTIIFVTVTLVVLQCVTGRPQNMNAQAEVGQQGGNNLNAQSQVSQVRFLTVLYKKTY